MAAFTHFKDAADKGDISGQVGLGKCYQHGYGCPQNHSMALSLFRKGVEHEHPEAFMGMGRASENGWGVTKDIPNAAEMFKKAALFGSEEGSRKYDKLIGAQ